MAHGGVQADSLAEERPDGDLGPAFELVKAREDIGHGAEPGVLDIGFARLHVRLANVAEVDHAEMDAADGGFIIVDETGNRFGVRGVNDDFLFELAPHAFSIHVFELSDFGVDRRDVATDADAALGSQAGFAAAAAALVFEEVDGAAGVGPTEEAVRNELLKAGVGFHFAAGAVFDMIADDKPRPVAVDLARETLEVSEVVEQRGGDDKNSFFSDERHGESFPQALWNLDR